MVAANIYGGSNFLPADHSYRANKPDTKKYGTICSMSRIYSQCLAFGLAFAWSLKASDTYHCTVNHFELKKVQKILVISGAFKKMSIFGFWQLMFQ